MSMENFKYIIAGLMVVVGTVQAATVTRCEVVKALQEHGVIDVDQLRNWLCLVDHASSYEYDSYATIAGKTYYGLFRMDGSKWCNKPSGYPGTYCLTLNANGCQYTCSSFLNDDITNDVNCAVRVKSCNGFAMWTAWSTNCDGVNLEIIPAYDPTTC